ncbi:tetratricopeptide repeat protein [Sphaerisporangium rubeum]|uniref:tetratricopeptide repeat protein n=1 Tax=Sphaerisporangium rubeum TaxID=321317 RepID=UPI00160B2D0F
MGRDGQLAQFRENLTIPLSDAQRRFIFNIHGNAGVGKSFLLQQLRQAAIEHEGVTACVSESIYGIPDTLAAIAADFALQGQRLKALEKRLAVYQELVRELEADPNAPQEAGTFFTHTAVKIGLHTAKGIPVVGSVAELIDADSLADQANKLRIYLGRKFRSHTDVQLLLSPSDELTPIFVEELGKLAKSSSPVCLFFDTYERTSPFLDGWLLDLLNNRHGALPGSLVITIAGQLPLDPNRWAAYLDVIADIPLAPFTDLEARQLLSRRGVMDDRVIEVILDLSGRLPLLVAMLAENRPADPGDVGDRSGDAVERFLKWEDDPSRRALALAAALSRRFNQDVVGLLADDVETRDAFNWLRRMPFITDKTGECHYHDVVRASMIRLQYRQSPQSWIKIHIRLAEGYKDWCEQLGLPDDEGWNNDSWASHTLEQAYHRLCASPSGALFSVLEQAVFACRIGNSLARRWAEMIMQAGVDTGDGDLRSWGKRLCDSLPATSSGTTDFLTELINNANLSQKTRAIALAQRGWQQYRSENEDAAVIDFNRAIELDSEYVWAIARRGETYRWMGRHEAALADFNRAIELDPEYAWAIASRGETYQAMGRHEAALADFNRAIELNPTSDWAIASRGLTYRWMGRHEAALADFNRAIELNPTSDWAIASRGLTYRWMGRHEAALADFNRAIELDPEYAGAIASRGETYQAMGRHEAALADFNRAIELNPTSDWAIARRGQTYQAMGRHEAALADFNRAIELDPNYAGAIASRGQTYQAMGRHETALADLNRAIELDPEYAWAIASRGQTYQAMGRHEAALADLNRAIELNPTSDWAIARRGQTYQAMGRHETALADFNRAIELNPTSDWAIASRGETYRLMGRHEAALADLNRAIELDPEYAWAIASRGQTYQAMGRHETALADLNRAIELDPEYAWAIASRGQTYQAMGRHEAALADFNRAIELNPTSDWAIARRGQTYQAMGRHEAALADFNRAIELNPTSDWAIASRGLTYRWMGRHEAALADFNRAIELDPNYAGAIAGRGETYRLMGRYEEALADLNKVIEFYPDLDWAITYRGRTYRQMGRHEEALADFNCAADLDPEYAEPHYERAVVYLLLADRDRAHAALHQAIDLGTQDIACRGATLPRLFDLALYQAALGAAEQAKILWAQAVTLPHAAAYIRCTALDQLRDLQRVIPVSAHLTELSQLLATYGSAD